MASNFILVMGSVINVLFFLLIRQSIKKEALKRQLKGVSHLGL